MIESFRHRGLRRLFEQDDRSRLPPPFVDKIRRILARLDAAGMVEDCDAPGFGLHALKGNLGGLWAVTVSRNWRVVFRFENGNVRDVDLVDYH